MQHAPGAASYHASPFRSDDGPLVWAHRGASAYAPENSLAAFERARELGADGIECDVMLCASGELVVCHDERLDRLCGLPVAVRELPLAELRRLVLLGARFPGVNATIPTLEEAVEAAGSRMLWNVELKVDRHEDAEPLARAAARAFARLPLEGRLLASSFHPLALLTLRTVAPEIPTAFLWEGHGKLLDLWNGLWGRVTSTAAVHPEHTAVSPEAVGRWRRAGLLVNTWTVDEPDELLRVREAGVDGVITNVPDVALRTYGR